MTIDNRPASTDEYTATYHVQGGDRTNFVVRVPAEPVTIEPRTRVLWQSVRQGLLMMVDGIERFLDMEPRTSELRKSKR